jgi:hypothetical protein
MIKKKKIGLIGLVTIIIAVSFILRNVSGVSGGSQSVEPRTSCILDIPYFPQKTQYYCGQACAQMILVKIQDKYISQIRLAPEMEFIPERGTLGSNLKHPFEKRDIGIVRVGRFSNLYNLRLSVDHGQYSILNIRYDEDSNSGHFVVVTGYNRTGFFLHDPYPKEWGTPDCRESGEDAYVSNGMLRKLWFNSRYWAITIGEPVPTDIPMVALGEVLR